jgi:putative ABC transport system ATP-binding protein
MTDDPHLRTFNLCRYYRRGRSEVRALDDVSVVIGRGEFLSLVGASGSGKTTLLNLLAGLDTPTLGAVEFDGIRLADVPRKERARQRALKIGMIFQSFNLIGHYSALQNVEMALCFNGTPPAERRRLATEALDRLGLADRLTHRPADLSGGEQQRVAVARAIAKRPDVLLCDEPTGALDVHTGIVVLEAIERVNRELGTTTAVITHNAVIAAMSSRVVHVSDGRVSHIDHNPSKVAASELQW